MKRANAALCVATPFVARKRVCDLRRTEGYVEIPYFRASSNRVQNFVTNDSPCRIVKVSANNFVEQIYN